MARRTQAKAPAVQPGLPWWLEASDEECPHCEQHYGHETEARCGRCDAPICSLCIVRAGRRVLCPDCANRGGR